MNRRGKTSRLADSSRRAARAGRAPQARADLAFLRRPGTSDKEKSKKSLPIFQKIGYALNSRHQEPAMPDQAMTDQAFTVPTSPPAASVNAIEREVRRHRILERALGGWSYAAIASTETLTPRRIRQIVRQTLARSQADRAAEHVRLQTARLGASLRLAAQRVEDGELGAIDRLLRVLDRLDRYQTRAAAPPPFDEAAEGAARFDAKLDDLVATAAEDKARAAAAAARGGPDGGAPPSPARA
jgi:hypothetical protein